MTELQFITFACDAPERLAAFWEAALDGERRDTEVPETALVDRPGDGPDLLFKRLQAGTKWRMALHLDLSVEDRTESVERLRELGATVRETKTEHHDGTTAEWTVLEDPEGNAFCVSEY
ncbi:VOC family protein [Halomicrobium sp. LC1Hm]|uniref:VOC family protein n=1 Tax=Halomicrobium sp. LC1Hm TaxID=2610902 RepID=UPI001298270F|nr:VOC family protein [Halomicrobium sp. LC1Hm]QGA84012.1 Glyoxalase/bleomycin resistanceprotein/dioxygenase [Halomicrobium sp. LC1Hm]